MNRRTFSSDGLRYALIAIVLLLVIKGAQNFFASDPYVSVPVAYEKFVMEEKWIDVVRAREPKALDVWPLREVDVALVPAIPPGQAKSLKLDPLSEGEASQKPIIVPPRPLKPAKVVVIIDDMGMNRTNTLGMIDLDEPLTLAFLPYAPHLDEYTKAARDKGHELMIHLPMEPLDGSLDIGPMGLRSGMSDADIMEQLENNIFPSFDGYKGINNHMGSRVTQDPRIMQILMKQLKKRDLYFVDSKTIQASVASDVAAYEGLRTADRDVFLDHYEDLDKVRGALLRLEKAARRNGVAIAIGHPKPNTLKALKEWLPTLKDKKLTLIPASQVVHTKQPSASIIAALEKKDVKPASAPITPKLLPAAVSAPNNSLVINPAPMGYIAPRELVKSEPAPSVTDEPEGEREEGGFFSRLKNSVVNSDLLSSENFEPVREQDLQR